MGTSKQTGQQELDKNLEVVLAQSAPISPVCSREQSSRFPGHSSNPSVESPGGCSDEASCLFKNHSHPLHFFVSHLFFAMNGARALHMLGKCSVSRTSSPFPLDSRRCSTAELSLASQLESKQAPLTGPYPQPLASRVSLLCDIPAFSFGLFCK